MEKEILKISDFVLKPNPTAKEIPCNCLLNPNFVELFNWLCQPTYYDLYKNQYKYYSKVLYLQMQIKLLLPIFDRAQILSFFNSISNFLINSTLFSFSSISIPLLVITP